MIARVSRSVLIGALFTFSLSGSQTPPSRCGGGQGPKPLTDISGTVGKNFRLLRTYGGGISEFSVREKSASIVYRAESNEILLLKLAEGRTYVVSKSQVPLSTISDPGERFLVTEPEGWIVDTEKGGNWTRFLSGVPNLKHLFWSKAALALWPDLHSFAETKGPKGEQQFHTFRYRATKQAAIRSCPILSPISAEPLRMGEGHLYPNVFMYLVKPKTGGNELSLYALNVETCALNGLGTYNSLFQGDIESVTWLGAPNAIAVKVDHPTTNLLWDNGTGDCRYYDIDNRKPFVLNSRVPVLATWDKTTKGINLVFLNAQKKATVLAGSAPFHELRSRDIYLTSDARKLYLNPRLQQNEPRTLLELTLPQ